jgi:Ser/Thr protein kinase RdoA (MazF antagonist)
VAPFGFIDFGDISTGELVYEVEANVSATARRNGRRKKNEME